MKTITILSGRCLLVELSENTFMECIIPDSNDTQCFCYFDGIKHESIKLPFGNWQLVGWLSELTEVQAAEIVPQKDFPDFSLNGNPITIRCYNDGSGKFEYTDALECLDSAIRAENWTFENKEQVEVGDELSCDYNRWLEAQSRVLDRSRSLLLRRV